MVFEREGTQRVMRARADVTIATIVLGLLIVAPRSLSAADDVAANSAKDAFYYAKLHFDPHNEREIEYGGAEMQFMAAVLDLCRTRAELRDLTHADLTTSSPEDLLYGPFSTLDVMAMSWGSQRPTPGQPPSVEPLLRVATDSRRVPPPAVPKDVREQVGWWTLCGAAVEDSTLTGRECAQIADWLCSRGFVLLTFHLHEDGQANGYYARLISSQPRDMQYVAAQMQVDPFWCAHVPNSMVIPCCMHVGVHEQSRFLTIDTRATGNGFRGVELRFVDPVGGRRHGWDVRVVNGGGDSAEAWKLGIESVTEFGAR